VATAYGIAEVLKKAIEKAGKIDDELINNALHTLDTTTVFGKYKVDPATGRQTGKKLFVIQIQDGKRNVIWPEDEATSKLRFPAPAWNKR
jgi:branched-chain amino acid transport system substrate-binding protein